MIRILKNKFGNKNTGYKLLNKTTALLTKKNTGNSKKKIQTLL